MKILQVLRLHILLAALFAPIALFMSLTGLLQSLGYNGSYTETLHFLQYDKPIEENAESMANIVRTHFVSLNEAPPDGWYGLAYTKNSFFLDWRGYNKQVKLTPVNNESAFSLTIKYPNLLRKLILLHKSEGPTIFLIFSISFSIVLLLILVTGGLFAFASGNYQSLFLKSTLASIFLFATVIYLSL